MATDYCAMALQEMARHGTVNHVQSNVRLSPFYVYLISNGQDVLQLGQGSGRRMTGCMRDGLAIKHNKAFICAVGEIVLGGTGTNQYYFVEMPNKATAESVEASIHTALGIATNSTGATLINGCIAKDIQGISNFLWARMKAHQNHLSLDATEKEMAEELFELVSIPRKQNHHRYLIPLHTVPGSQGDFLEGHILRDKLGASYLIPIFIALTDSYLRYESHAPTPAQFSHRKSHYLSHSNCPKCNRCHLDYHTRSEELGDTSPEEEPDGARAESHVSEGLRKTSAPASEESKNDPNAITKPLHVTEDQLKRLVSTIQQRQGYLNTKNGDFETNSRDYFFVIEKPGRNPQRVKACLNAIAGGILELKNLNPTGRADGKQFSTQFGGCYVVLRGASMKTNRSNWFSYP